MENGQKLWGGRFTGEADETFREFNRSFSFDKQLLHADIAGSMAHAGGLFRAGVITAEEHERIVAGLNEIRREAADPQKLESDDEDVHSFIESRLIAKIGEAGKKLHTGRSRNDQVATAFRIWVRETSSELSGLVRDLQNALVAAAERHRDAVLPGYTHLQRAQPIMWAHWCLAYFEMCERDRARLAAAASRANTMPLGAGALAGTSYDIDRDAVAAELGFSSVTANSLDAVSDRDFAIEFVGACAIAMMHLSRLAEDLILYASTEFGFVSLSDAVSTGSSLMPQKKNPDALELIRGKAGRVFGHHAALLAVMKGLPLAYNKDMQEDKEAVFDTAETVSLSLRVARIVLDNLTVNEDVTRSVALSGYLNATELADHLVSLGRPFRTAHDIAGRLVLKAIDQGKELHELSLDELRSEDAAIDERVFEALTLESTLGRRSVSGGTSPARVREALAAAKERLAEDDRSGERA